MKNKSFLLKILLMVLIFGMTVFGCKDDPDDGNGNGDNGNSSGGTFTLTDIPSKYEGKYAALEASPHDSRDYVITGMNYNPSTLTNSFVRISNGRVNLPLWISIYSESGVSGKRYSGNDAVQVSIFITSSAAGGAGVAQIMFDSITFSTGNATKSFNDSDHIRYLDDENGNSNDGTVDSRLNGTWISTQKGMEVELKLANGSFEESVDDILLQKGTYTTNGNNITLQVTHLHGSAYELEARWYSINELLTILKVPDEFIAEFEFSTATYTISGNTLIIMTTEGETITFTRKN